MSAEEIRELLQQLQRGINQPLVALECRYDNLETVYISLTEAGEVLVSDHGRTFAYLGRWNGLNLPADGGTRHGRGAETCRRSGAELRCDDPAAFPRIECVADPVEAVAKAVDRVAEGVDRVFHLAKRDDLK